MIQEAWRQRRPTTSVFRRSARTWKRTYWRGVNVWKNPLDLWLYQEILHEVAGHLFQRAII